MNTGEFGDVEQQNPYAGMGYDTLPDPSGGRSDTTLPQGTLEHLPAPSVEQRYLGLDPPPVDRAPPGNRFFRPPTRSAGTPDGRVCGLASRAMHLSLKAVGWAFVVMVGGTLLLGGVDAIKEQWEESRQSRLEAEERPPNVRDDRVVEGQCFNSLSHLHGRRLELRDCWLPHRFEAVSNHVLGNDAYPGGSKLRDTAETICSDEARLIAERYSDARIIHDAMYPSEAGWDSGDRSLTCFISANAPFRLLGSSAQKDLEVL